MGSGDINVESLKMAIESNDIEEIQKMCLEVRKLDMDISAISSEMRRSIVKKFLSSDDPSFIYDFFMNDKDFEHDMHNYVFTLKGVEKIKLQLIIDYKYQIDALRLFKIIEEDNLFYTADYKPAFDGGVIPNIEQSEDKQYYIPSISKIFEWFTDDKQKIYKEMLDLGCVAKLQLTPIGLSLQTFLDRANEVTIDNKSVITPQVKNANLIYAPEFYNVDENSIISMRGGKTKREYIKENDGWVVDLVFKKFNSYSKFSFELESDNSIASKLANFKFWLMQKKMVGLSFESYVVLKMLEFGRLNNVKESGDVLITESAMSNETLVSNSRSHDCEDFNLYLASSSSNELMTDICYISCLRLNKPSEDL